MKYTHGRSRSLDRLERRGVRWRNEWGVAELGCAVQLCEKSSFRLAFAGTNIYNGKGEIFMKRKITSILLSLSLWLSCSGQAFAAEPKARGLR